MMIWLTIHSKLRIVQQHAITVTIMKTQIIELLIATCTECSQHSTHTWS